ncbi:hypothetical protein AU825_23675 [Salmonella enterica subsp. salamae]|nr:hypothetical protein [Salmonella enterica subsp. salamae]
MTGALNDQKAFWFLGGIAFCNVAVLKDQQVGSILIPNLISRAVLPIMLQRFNHKMGIKKRSKIVAKSQLQLLIFTLFR